MDDKLSKAIAYLEADAEKVGQLGFARGWIRRRIDGDDVQDIYDFIEMLLRMEWTGSEWCPCKHRMIWADNIAMCAKCCSFEFGQPDHV